MTDAFDLDDQINWLATISVSNLNTESLIKASRLIRVIRRETDIVINLRSNSWLVELGKEVIRLDKVELNKEFQSLINLLKN